MPSPVKVDEAGKPTLNGVIELANDAFSQHAGRIEEYNAMRRLVDREFKPFAKNPPDRFRVMKPGTAGALLHRAASQVVSDTPIVTYEPRNDGKAAQDEADLAERFGLAVLQGAERAQLIAPLEDAAKQGILGLWCLKGPIFDFHAWPDPPTSRDRTRKEYDAELKTYRIKQAERFAFEMKSVDPTTVVWDQLSPWTPSWVVRRYTVPVWSLKHRYPQWKAATGAKPEEPVPVYEYWDDTWRCLVAGTDWVSYENGSDGKPAGGPVPNLYGYVPYQIGVGAWGFADGSPKELARSMLFFAQEWLLEEARIASLKSWNAQLYGMAAIVSGDPERTKEELAEFAAILSVPAGQDIEKAAPRPMKMPEPPPWLERYEQTIKGNIIEATYSPALAGYREPGTTSGVMSGLHIGEGKLQFAPISKRLSQQAGRFLNRVAHIVENIIQEPVSVWVEKAGHRDLVTIEPDIWHGSYHYNVSLEPVDPTRDDRRAMLGLNLFAQGAIDIWTMLEDYLRIPDATGVLKRRLKWEVINSPEFRAAMVAEVATEAGFEELVPPPAGSERGSVGATGDFAAFEGGNALEPDRPNAAPDLEVPRRGEALNRQGRLSPRVSGPLEGPGGYGR
jgi:hypothetical protein